MVDIPSLITGTAARYGIDPNTFMRFGQIESGLNPNAHNPSGAAGLFQIMPGTGRPYNLTNPYDAAANADVAARLFKDNQSYLSRQLGRAPTGAEMYLAHQQGAGGAAKLLSNPNALAASIVGAKAILQNGGSQDMTAGQYANLWAKKFDGTTVGAPQLQLQLPAIDPNAALALAGADNPPLADMFAQQKADQEKQQKDEQARRIALFSPPGSVAGMFS